MQFVYLVHCLAGKFNLFNSWKIYYGDYTETPFVNPSESGVCFYSSGILCRVSREVQDTLLSLKLYFCILSSH